MTPSCPMVPSCSNHLHHWFDLCKNISSHCIYLLSDPSLVGKKTYFLLKVGLKGYLETILPQPKDKLWVIKSWRRCRWATVQFFPSWNDSFKENRIYVGKQEFWYFEVGCIFPWWLQVWNSRKGDSNDKILGFRKNHRRGNPNNETLQVVENLEKILMKGKGKDQEGTFQLERSFFFMKKL